MQLWLVCEITAVRVQAVKSLMELHGGFSKAGIITIVTVAAVMHFPPDIKSYSPKMLDIISCDISILTTF